MKRLLLVAAVSIALLSGCAHNPQVAATVDGHKITTDDLDVLTNALCVEQVLSGQGQQFTTAALRESALSALISSQVYADYADEHDLSYQPLQLARQVDQLDDLIGKLPEENRDRARTLITDLLRGQMQLQQVATRRLHKAGKTPSPQTISATIQKIERKHAKKMETLVNPRYDTGTTESADGSSVSQAVSATAKSALDVLRGNAGKDTAAYVASLPSTQRCG